MTASEDKTSIRRIIALSLVLALGLVMMVGAATAGAAPSPVPQSQTGFVNPNQISENLDGCRFFTGLQLPDAIGKFICPDGAYVSGNLGKGWNELDLVPHRLTTSAGNQANVTTAYNLMVVGDYQASGGKVGWDFISIPVVNTAKSDASCTVTAGDQGVGEPVTGGTISSIYRILTIHQAKGATCVFDYYMRLAVGAHLFSGSSLQSYTFELPDFKTGKKTLSIPVNETLSQSLGKDMTATQGTNHAWDITKATTPATISFGNTCNGSEATSQGVDITVTWTKQQATPDGPITIITHVYATNPAARAIVANVTDKIYSGTTLLETASTSASVAANSTQLVLTHTFLAPSGTSNLNDIASATYTDPVALIDVPGSTSAQASAVVQFTGPELNASATVNDTEKITGDGFTYSADSFTPANGNFDGGYVAGTPTTDDVSWTSTDQNSSGSVTFNKTIYVDGPGISKGSLTDTAAVNGSDGLHVESSPATIGIRADAKVTLQINKTIDRALDSGSQMFTFHVKDSGDNEVGSASIQFTAGESALTKSVVVSNLAPGTYTVSEDAVTGWTMDTAKTATIELPNCSGSVSFTNLRVRDLTVSKTATASFHRTYKWQIDKSVDQTTINIADGGTAIFNYSVKVTPDGYTDSAWAVTGKITVANPNLIDFAGVNVTDAIGNSGSCAVTGGTNVTVPASSNVVLDYSCTYAAAPSPAAGTNTATATWDKATYFTPNGSASGTAGVDFSTVTPSETNKVITVGDDETNPADPQTLGTSDYYAGPFEYKYSLDQAGVAGKCTDYTNTATFTTNPPGATGSASQTVTVCVGVDLTVSKTAAGTFDRTYLWTISKDVNQTRVNIAEGNSYTFQYTVVVEQTGISDAGWTLGGKITLTNPNDWEDITLTSLADVVDNGGACTVAAGPYTVLAGKTLEVPYSCSYASAPSSYMGLNTATATWAAATYFTPTGSAEGTAKFALAQKGATNQTVTVTDTYGGDLGTVTATDSAPFAKGTFNYDRTVSGVAGTCTPYDNTATITETGQKDSETVLLCVGKDLTVSKTAAGTFDRAYKWLIDKSVDKTQIEIAQGGTATFNYTVKVTPDGYTDSNWKLSGTITIVNPNDWEDVTVSVADTLDKGGSCTITEAAPYVAPKSGSLVLHYSCTTDGTSTKNTAEVTWNKATYATPTGSGSGTADVSFTVASETNKTITVVDDKTDPLHPVTLGTWNWADGTHSFTYSLDKQGVAGTCTDYTNTATITETGQFDKKTVEVCVGLDLTVSKTAAGTFNRTYLWDILKVVDNQQLNIASGASALFNYTVKVFQTGISDSGWTLSGKITITNPNAWEAITANVTDAVGAPATCDITNAGVKVTNVSIPASETVVLDYTCAFASQPEYSGTNTATVTWDKSTYATPNASASGTADFTLAQAGSTNKTVHVTDSLGGDLGSVTATDAAPFASQDFSYSKSFTGTPGTCKTYDNTATITETKDTASQTVKVCVGVDLTVSKTAAGTFDRTYLWEISKNVDKTLVRQMSGSVTFNYTVDVWQTGIQNSNWKLSGKITVTNPNDWEAITADVTDVVDNGGTCVVTNGAAVVVAAGKSVELPYSCTFTTQPAYSGTNTATVTWDKSTYATPNASAIGSAAFTLAQAGSINKTINVTDSFKGPLGTVTATDAAPFATATFSYPRTVQVPAAGCQKYDNTATITGTDKSDSETVQVCKPSLLTNSSLCSLPNDQLKLIYTPDQAAGLKLNASNPGQYYYNMFYAGPGDVDLTLTLAYPFVTQGAVPIHIYSNVGVKTDSSGITCLTPIGELANSSTQVVLTDYEPEAFGTQTTVTVHVPTLPEGFAYINIHLDYGFKGTTGYAKGGPSGNDAVDVTDLTKVLILDGQTYAFSDTGGGSASVTSTNAFKKNPGIGGLLFKKSDTTPIGNAKVEIAQVDSTNTKGAAKVTATVYTDEDGWYMLPFKWTGKAASFTVKMPAYNLTQTITLKANGYVNVNFVVP